MGMGSHCLASSATYLSGTMGILPGQSFSTALENYGKFDHSVAFKLCLENYSNQHLKDPQYLDHSGKVYDPPCPVAPGMAEYMTGHNGNLSGVSGVVSWGIGDTGKMVVVMYEKPWSHLPQKKTLLLLVSFPAEISPPSMTRCTVARRTDSKGKPSLLRMEQLDQSDSKMILTSWWWE